MGGDGGGDGAIWQKNKLFGKYKHVKEYEYERINEVVLINHDYSPFCNLIDICKLN